jgi:serine phosphatase RsbU (regulator of sigma subunit)
MSVIATEFLTQLELKNAFTFFLTDQNKFDLKQVGIENPIGSIAIESDFIEYFESQSDPIYLESIPEKAVADITNFKFEPDSLLFAIHSSKQLKGIFVLSPKLSEDTFSSSDMKLLDTITNQIMVVFDRIAKERELAHANSQLKDLNDNLEQKVQSQVKEIEEKRKIEKDLEMASTIQRSVLPKCSPKINNYSFHASFYPSRKIGGDYYNFFPFSENEIGILLCDVAGKGISSAIMMMELHSLVHRLVKPDLSPKDFMFQLNNAIVNNQIIKKQVATFYGVLNNETHALTYCNGGHDEGYLFTGTQCLPLAESSGLSPGFMEDQDYKNEMTSMKNGDALMVFTDGLTDVESPDHEKYGLDRVLDAAKAYRKSKGSFETLGQALVSEWQAFKADNNLQKDDMTLITIEHERLPLFVPNNEDL